jgi:hypothetical protein
VGVVIHGLAKKKLKKLQINCWIKNVQHIYWNNLSVTVDVSSSKFFEKFRKKFFQLFARTSWPSSSFWQRTNIVSENVLPKLDLFHQRFGLEVLHQRTGLEVLHQRTGLEVLHHRFGLEVLHRGFAPSSV